MADDAILATIERVLVENRYRLAAAEGTLDRLDVFHNVARELHRALAPVLPPTDAPVPDGDDLYVRWLVSVGDRLPRGARALDLRHEPLRHEQDVQRAVARFTDDVRTGVAQLYALRRSQEQS